MKPIRIAGYTLTCSLGAGLQDMRASLNGDRRGLSDAPWPGSDVRTWLGRIEPEGLCEVVLPRRFESRNNRIARLALGQDGFMGQVRAAIEKYSAARCALVLGTSTSSIDRSESSYTRLQANGEFHPGDNHASLHNPHSTAEYVAHLLGIDGPTVTISTACSSSAKAFATAARWLTGGLVDSVVVGGVDSLCLSVICGFNALQLVSPEPCAPFDEGRSGLNLGEAGGFALLTLDEGEGGHASLLGYGESLDAHHMSSAHPEGQGAEQAIRAASVSAGVPLENIDYLNFHGTGTVANDQIEGMVCSRLFPESLLCSSTKGWTGHTLGAAGITEAVICIDAFETGLLPATINTSNPESELKLQLLQENKLRKPDFVMSNSFGFGGNNCSLIFGGVSS